MKVNFFLASLTLAMSSDENFPFVHPTIAAILRCQPQRMRTNQHKSHIEPHSLKIVYIPTQDIIDTQTLIELARDCEQALFHLHDQTDAFVVLPPLLQGLVHMCHENHVAATLLALNSLESSIRRHTNHTTGKSPLLKTMLEHLDDSQVTPILKSLLLPRKGQLNLRNLLWHGFVTSSSLPRAWLALVIVLIHHLDQKWQGADSVHVESFPTLPDLRSHDSLRRLLETRLDDSNISFIRTSLAASQHDLFDVAIEWRNRYPVCATALLAIILEHHLRIQWSRCNHRPDDCIAQPNSYYVTMDGHGQRDRHELMLHPFCFDPSTNNHLKLRKHRNEMISYLGASTIALLIDLFASSSGELNIRAALAHGLWDSCLIHEIFSRTSNSTTEPFLDPRCIDILHLVMIALFHVTCQKSSQLQYKPIFSYTATTRQYLKSTLDSLERIESMQQSQVFQQIVIAQGLDVGFTSSNAIFQPTSTSTLQEEARTMMQVPVDWTDDGASTVDIFAEYESNVALSSCVAARRLLLDLSEAAESYNQMLHHAVQDLILGEDSRNGKKSKLRHRQKQQSLRLIAMVEITWSVYTFLTRIAMISIYSKLARCLDHPTSASTTSTAPTSRLTPEELLKAVERSRMCLSTYSTFLSTDHERAIKSVTEFKKGKAIQKVMANVLGES